MDRGNRSELLKKIEAQQEKIQKYENKLRDLISAYKGVIKEKEALEASVKALVASQPVHIKRPEKTKKVEDGSKETDGQSAQSEEGNDEHDESEIFQLREQLSTLTVSLSTLTQEKSKLETNFLTDKKIIRQELEEKNDELENERHRHDQIVEELTHDITQWKNKLRSQQYEREREHSDHAMMLRELQKLLSVERSAKEAMENQVDELRDELNAKAQSSDVCVDQYKKRIEELQVEVTDMKKKMRIIEEHSLKPAPEYLELQKEMLDVKTEHQYLLQKEQIKRSETETMLDTKVHESEDKISLLEARISELSEMVGNYERLRTHDLNQVSKLKERVSQLDMENTALAQTTTRHSGLEQELGSIDNNSEVQAILDKMFKLKDMLKTANERSGKPVIIEELLQDLGVSDPDTVHKKCQHDYEMIREEFERYKLRAQSVLKNKSSKESSPHSEVDIYKSQISDLKERLYHLRTDYEEQTKLLRTKEDTFHMSLTTLKENHNQDLINTEADWKQRMSDLDSEIRRHRERTIAMLADKDGEIQKLRVRLPDHLETQYISTYRQMSQSSDPEIGASSEGENAVGELLSRSKLHGAPAETTLLHFAQEQARKEVELQSLRKQKHAVEMGMRELQQTSILKEQRYIEQIDLLKEEVRKYERNISRESANLEYLKNVVYHFMVCSDELGKQGTLNAISTILQFSPQEKVKVQRELQRGWWNYVNAQNKTKI